jgi:hypothetical protein
VETTENTTSGQTSITEQFANAKKILHLALNTWEYETRRCKRARTQEAWIAAQARAQKAYETYCKYQAEYTLAERVYLAQGLTQR